MTFLSPGVYAWEADSKTNSLFAPLGAPKGARQSGKWAFPRRKRWAKEKLANSATSKLTLRVSVPSRFGTRYSGVLYKGFAGRLLQGVKSKQSGFRWVSYSLMATSVLCFLLQRRLQLFCQLGKVLVGLERDEPRIAFQKLYVVEALRNRLPPHRA